MKKLTKETVPASKGIHQPPVRISVLGLCERNSRIELVGSGGRCPSRV